MITEIGIVAGEIWHCLDEYGPSQFSVMLSKLGRPKDIVLMSLGWLAREGHVILEGEGDYRISLRDKSV